VKTFVAAYSRADIERLMPCLWDEEKAINGIPNPLAADHDMPKGSPPNPKHAGGHMVAVADLRTAWARADLPIGERQALYLRFALDSLLEEIADDLSVSKSTASRRVDRGIGRLGEFLNGRPYKDEEEDEHEDHAA
jgi:DNA-directed RNA polymerase specialized sigma24 family protein